MLGLLHENGFIVVNDYGSVQTTDSKEFEHQRYTGSTFVGVNFGLLKAYFSDSGKCQWIEPAEDSKHIYSRLLGHQIGAETKARFTELFCKSAFDRLEEPAQQARDQAKNGRYEAAAAAFRRALERQPYNWMLMREAATGQSQQSAHRVPAFEGQLASAAA